MHRRNVLRLLSGGAVAGGAGCLGVPTAPAETPSSETSRHFETDTATETPQSSPPQRRRGQATVDLHPRESVTFERDTAKITCACVAADAVHSYIDDSIENTAGVGVGCGKSLALLSEFEVTVHPTTKHGRDDKLLSTPAVDFDRLVGVTPSSASATIENGQTIHRCTIPVYVVHEEVYVD